MDFLPKVLIFRQLREIHKTNKQLYKTICVTITTAKQFGSLILLVL